MDLGIAGRKAIVCGSSGGLGRACAEALAEAGCEVVINGRNQEKLDATAKAMEARTKSKIIAVVADVGTEAGRKALFAACPEPDILINNNSGPPVKDFRKLSHEDMIKGIEGNMLTAIEMTQAAIDAMVRRKFGRIVNITSGSVKMPLPGTRSVIGRARRPHGVSRRRRTFGRRSERDDQLHAARHVRHRPPHLQSAGVGEERRHHAWRKPRGNRTKTIPARRFGEPAEFGATCAFLCSVHAGYITGQNILMDGGAFPGAF